MKLMRTIFRKSACAAILICCSTNAFSQSISISDDELYAVASTQYMIIHDFYVYACAYKYGFDYTNLANQFISRYGEFFRRQETEAQRVFHTVGISYEDFAKSTMKYPKQLLSKGFCSNLGRALVARVEDVNVVEKGIETQRLALKPAFQQ